MTYPFDCITNFIFVETEIAPADVILVPGASHSQLMGKAASLYQHGLVPYILPSKTMLKLESSEPKTLSFYTCYLFCDFACKFQLNIDCSYSAS
ncbi:hypothetical protein COL91_00705 [Bacillus pseudomycoides]|nr:hypothetical protein COO02_10940 [Bacillus pseudomycoides]PEI92350.1 hypothetical protein CN679_10720 [Bacillus pseudomycoides]PGA94962.1 hypothetical protein COL91_00705 [Bacillus pseudomycoides]PHF35106.1 hypothetical protein COF72_27025 [Bacillus pseudomycoides]